MKKKRAIIVWAALAVILLAVAVALRRAPHAVPVGDRELLIPGSFADLEAVPRKDFDSQSCLVREGEGAFCARTSGGETIVFSTFSDVLEEDERKALAGARPDVRGGFEFFYTKWDDGNGSTREVFARPIGAGDGAEHYALRLVGKNSQAVVALWPEFRENFYRALAR